MALTRRLPRIDPRGLFTRNVPWKIAAVFVALLVWVVSALAAPPEVTMRFEGKIPVERAQLPDGYIVRGSLGEVEVVTRGPEDALRRLQVTSFRAEVDLDGYDLALAGEPQDIPVRVRVSDGRVSVVEVSPTTVAVRLVRVATKVMTVQVQLEDQPPAGYQAGPPTVVPAEVEVRAPADALREVATVVVGIRFGGTTSDVTLAPRAIPLDATGREVVEAETIPGNVEVTVPVLPARTTRTVAVTPVIRGALAAGYWIAGVAVDPPAVTLRGEATVLEGIDSVDTSPINVSGATSDRTVRVSLLLPTGTSLARPADVSVAINVEPARGTRSFPAVAVRLDRLASGATAEYDPGTVEVVLAGPAPTLLQIQPEALSAVVDMDGRGSESYAPEIRGLPPGVTVVSVTPAQIRVTVRSS